MQWRRCTRTWKHQYGSQQTMNTAMMMATKQVRERRAAGCRRDVTDLMWRRLDLQ